MLNFCTLFDSVYLSRGVAMYESLKSQCVDFHLYIYAFDDVCYDFFCRNKLDYITVVSLDDFEDEELLSVKKSRSRGEYCWTCTPSIIKYTLEHYRLKDCTYLDADLYFFASPQVLLEEVGMNSVLITEHRYTKKYDQTNTSGKYCVQFVFFKNDERGRKVLEWWRNACLEWCYDRQEDGRFGDQKYLDDWMTRFEGVCELQYLGGGVAPWNMQQYTFIKKKSKVYGVENISEKRFEVVFFHFHSLAFFSPYFFSFVRGYDKNGKGGYNYLFVPYLVRILKIRKKYTDIAQNERYVEKEMRIRSSFYEKMCCLWGFVKMLMIRN